MATQIKLPREKLQMLLKRVIMNGEAMVVDQPPPKEYGGSSNYIVSAQKPTVVNAAIVGNFRTETELDMIISRVNRIEHFLVTEEGLKPYREIPVFGRIATLNSFRLPGEKLDSILILTVKYHLAILSFDNTGGIRTRAYGYVADRVGRPTENGIIACVHSTGLIALRLYEGSLKLIQWRDDEELKIFNVRFEDHNVTDIGFLETDKPTVAYFYEDPYGKHLKICEIDVGEKEMLSPLWRQGNIEAEATLLIPVPQPYGGLVVVGQESISYQKDANHYTAVAPPLIHMAHFNCYARIDKSGERFLLGDVSGRLFMLLLIRDQSRDDIFEVKDLKVELLGDVSIPECLVYLDNSVVFVGSRYGDSQLIKLATEPIDSSTNSFVMVLDTLTNLGPIRDFVIIDNEGQNQLVTCSGAFKNGCLRIVRSGIGIDMLATVEMPIVKRIFTLRLNSEIDRFLVISFSNVTHVLACEEEEMEDTQIDDFDLSQATLFAGNLSSDRIVQVTRDFVSLISGDGTFKTKWVSPAKLSLCSANMNSGQLVVGSGAEIFYLVAASDEIRLVGKLECTNEISCIDITPVDVDSSTSSMFAAGFWNDHSVIIYSTETLRPIIEEKLASEVLPRSVLIILMENIYYLLVALGDGTIYYYRIDRTDCCLTDMKKVTLGTQPISLKKFISKGIMNVFACSDRPAVIYSSNQKLAFSNVNMKIVSQMAQLNSDFYKNCLVMSDGDNLIIGTIDDIQKLHIRTVPLGESVSRIAYQAETGTIAILTTRYEYVSANGSRATRQESVTTLCTSKYTGDQRTMNAPRMVGANSSSSRCNTGASGSASNNAQQNQPTNATIMMDENDIQSEVEVHSLCILDANTFECQCVYELSKNEYGLSLCSAQLAEDPMPYFVVGTAFVYGDGVEAKQGRILVFQVQPGTNASDGNKIRLISEKEVKGAVYSMTTLSQKIICAINSSVRLFEWTAERELRLECSHFNFITALYLKTKGDLVLVGDLMRSVCLLSYKQIDSSFEEVARDYAAEWMSACEIINSDTFLGAENNYNIFCAQKDDNAETDDDRMRLKQVGMFYLGEMINVFRRGTIIPAEPDMSPVAQSFSTPILYGTGDGGLGLIMQIPTDIYDFLFELQKKIAQVTHNCMRIDHNDYRNFSTEKRSEPWKGFIDGDLVESLADMPIETVRSIVADLKMPASMSTGGSADIPQPSTSSGDVVVGHQHHQKRQATVSDVLKLIEDLSRTH